MQICENRGLKHASRGAVWEFYLRCQVPWRKDDTQCGFRPARSTTEQVSTLQQIFEKSWEYAKHDLEKSYDRVPREKLWGVLREYGVDGRLLLAVKSLYSCSEVCVHVGGVNHNCSQWVLDSNKGVCCHHYSS